MKFRTKCIEVSAVQWTGDSSAELSAFCKDKVSYLLMSPLIPVIQNSGTPLEEPDRERCKVSIGDWVINNPTGTFQVCNDGTFKTIFEPVD